MKNVKLRPSKKGVIFAKMLQMKPSKLAENFNYLPKSLWRMMSKGQKKIFLFHRHRINLARNVSEFSDIRIDHSNPRIKVIKT